MTNEQIHIQKMTLAELHQAIIDRTYDHADMERGIMARIAAIPRSPLGADGRWWSFPTPIAILSTAVISADDK